ncbi:hypothetical protein [Rhodococcus sp. ARC_M5]|uniref:hypothetical protein n=1 Tax=Rhodococcus sp. ARC_M5 TaxID=2928851 RepID=UPI001FB3D7EA|nr:hypothetical protein [Rhodococcus sp. ARC_M5]
MSALPRPGDALPGDPRAPTREPPVARVTSRDEQPIDTATTNRATNRAGTAAPANADRANADRAIAATPPAGLGGQGSARLAVPSTVLNRTIGRLADAAVRDGLQPTSRSRYCPFSSYW